MSTARENKPARPPRPLKLRVHGWLRWLHIYISMFSLLAILFFALTGITLNHPDWTFGNIETRKDSSGTLPANWKNGKEVNWLKVAEYLRQQNGVHGISSDPQSSNSEASISFKAPGYSADCFIKPEDGTYTLSTTATGFVGVLNDFHRGQNAGPTWARVIDLCGVSLSLVALTGLGLLFYLKKIRTAALLTMAGGVVLVLILMKMAM